MLDFFKEALVVIRLKNGKQKPVALCFEEEEAARVIKRLDSTGDSVHTVYKVAVDDPYKIGNEAFLVSKAGIFLYPEIVSSDYSWALKVSDQIELNTSFSASIHRLPVLLK